MHKFFSLKCICYIIFFLDLILLSHSIYLMIGDCIPDDIMLINGVEEKYEFNIPVKMCMNSGNDSIIIDEDNNSQKELTLIGDKLGNYEATISLFGIINLKDVNIKVIDPIYLYPVGKCSGIYVKTDGVMVLGTGMIRCSKATENYEIDSPAKNIIKSGDYVMAVNGKAVNSYDEIITQVHNASDDKIILSIRRDKELIDVAIKRVLDCDGNYKLGIWMRENLQGIGTITYLDEKGEFGALGHGICDSSNSLLMEIEEGQIYEPYIKNIVKGRKNNPGELYGIINYSEENYIGEIYSNNECGIFGQINEDKKEYFTNELELCPIKLKNEVKKGDAQIICCVDGERKKYNIYIEDIDLNNKENRNMIIKITDEELLEETNGIVQGMSGSPIIQDGKIVGAVTHVFVKDPTKGYGIFIEEMINRD